MAKTHNYVNQIKVKTENIWIKKKIQRPITVCQWY